MQITEVRIKLCEENNERLLAFCSVTFDNAFVVRDLKIIEGTRGMFVAMPSRKLTDRCTHCGCKNHLRSRFCNNCGRKLDEARATKEVPDGRAKLHADIAHPIHSGAREHIQSAIAKAFIDERERSKQPGYICRYDEFDFDDDVPANLQETSKPHGYKTHGPHQPASRGSHLSDSETPVSIREDSFGSGIM